MQAYKYDKNGYFEEVVERQLDPLASLAAGVAIYLLPADSTDVEIIPPKDGFKRKFNGVAWEYEEIPQPKPYEPTEEEIKQQKINELKQKLNNSDYCVIKIAEGVATPEEYSEVLANRQLWRAQINELEGNE